jgi:aminomethyltransferase
MVLFVGWDMPVVYPSGPIKEHPATRKAVGLFYIDHMTQVDNIRSMS